MPFWLLKVVKVEVWKVEVILGIAFSSQTRSSRVRAVLKLMLSVSVGRIRCIIIGK